MNIIYYGHESNGCDWYRAISPLKTLAKQDPSYKVLEKNSLNIARNMNKKPKEMIDESRADIVLIPRIITESLVDHVIEFNKQYNPSCKIVIDHDDNVFNLSPFNPEYSEYGTEEYDMNVGGQIIPIWRKSEYFNIEENQKRLDSIKRNVSRADLVTVTNEHLRNEFLQYNDNVKILPNCIDMRRWVKPEFKESDEIRLFWSGGISHYEDFYYLRDPLRIIMEKYKNVKLVLMGLIDDKTGKFRYPGLLKGIEESRIEVHDWEHLMAYPFKVALLNPTIGLIPLRYTNFNICKSPIKWLELGAMKVPCVSSLVPPYKDMIPLSKEDNGVFIEQNDDVDAWVKGVSALIEDKILRIKMGQAAYQTVLENFSVEKKCHLWADAYQETINASSNKCHAQ